MLELIRILPDSYFTLEEYVLFITKIKSHEPEKLRNAANLIKAFRMLSSNKKQEYIKDLNKLDKKLYPTRTRTNYISLKDSASKEIDAFTVGGIITKGVGEQQSCFAINDKARLLDEIRAFNRSVKFIDFKDKLDWISYLGDLEEFSLDEVVEMYLRNGKSPAQIETALKSVKKEKIEATIFDKLYEREIENYYELNITEIDPNLEIVSKPHSGRQFPTHIGPIDLLCRDKTTKEYVVIELKRGQATDDTVGQILRYMGWVYVHMSSAQKRVRGILVGKDFSNKIDYALMGAQSNDMEELITKYSHPFDENNRPLLCSLEDRHLVT